LESNRTVEPSGASGTKESVGMRLPSGLPKEVFERAAILLAAAGKRQSSTPG
jgi:hypothetical protein